MSSLFEELKRRNVFKVAAAYAIGGWVLIEVAATILPIFGAPEWILQVFTFFVMLGFPVALVLSWIYDITPEGIERTGDAPAGTAAATGSKLNFAIVGLLIIAVAYLAVDRYVLNAPRPPFAGTEVDPASLTTPLDEPPVAAMPIAPPPVSAESQQERLPNSVAVLPFANLSPDPDNAFFAAGIHESILNELAKIRDMSVIARTSVLRFADGTTPIPEIADDLNVETVMEGSVRYAGNRVRITAQLIDPDTGAHLWSEEYDRDLDDIFAIQSDIATRVAMALEAELLPREQESIENIPTDSLEAYALFLRARNLARAFFESDDTRAEMLNLYDRALALDPDFADAHAGKAALYVGLLEADLGSPETWHERRAELEALVRESAGRALALDPTTGTAYAELGDLESYYRRAASAREAYRRALELSPNHPEILRGYAYVEAHIGDHEAAEALMRRTIALDPDNPRLRFNLGDILGLAQSYPEAAETTRVAIALDPTYSLAHVMLGVLEALLGNTEAALDQLQVAESLFTDTTSASLLAELAYGYARAGSRADAERIARRVETLALERRVGGGSWALVHLALGNEAEILGHLEAAAEDVGPDEGFFELNGIYHNYWSDPILEQPEFVAARERLAFRDE
ncbi:MAG TPA: tetratricopeptide repeat protein [Gammaproteobacteria bacterium]